MAEMNDYSGELRPRLDMHDFSKDALVSIYRSCSILYSAIDGAWYSLLREKYGDKIASELHWELWKRHTAMDVGLITGPMKLGNTVADVLKFLQLTPGGGGFVYADADYEMKSENHGIFTVKRCAGMGFFENTNDAAAQANACGLESWGLQGMAKVFNPKIKVTCLKAPPKLPDRQGEGEIACQWDFKLEE